MSLIKIDINKKNEQIKQARIAELKQLLSDSDFKVLPDYKKRAGKTDEEMAAILDERKAWYDELQELCKD